MVPVNQVEEEEGESKHHISKGDNIMNLRVLEKSENYIRFILGDVDVAFANALRRIMISEVPTLAIDEVVILENTSPLFDEILAHRLGMIPLITDLDTYVLPSKCDCKGAGCPQCQVTLTLEKEATDEPVMVYSRDLKSQDPKIKAAIDKIPILKLAKGQRLLLEAYAKLGISQDHAKWQAATTATFKYMPIIIVENDKVDESCKKVIDACPRQILTWEVDSKGKPKIGIVDAINCSLCQACVEACETDAIQIQWSDRTFIFDVESTGAHPAEKIVEVAIQILQNKAVEFSTQLKVMQKP